MGAEPEGPCGSAAARGVQRQCCEEAGAPSSPTLRRVAIENELAPPRGSVAVVGASLAMVFASLRAITETLAVDRLVEVVEVATSCRSSTKRFDNTRLICTSVVSMGLLSRCLRLESPGENGHLGGDVPERTVAGSGVIHLQSTVVSGSEVGDVDKRASSRVLSKSGLGLLASL